MGWVRVKASRSTALTALLAALVLGPSSAVAQSLRTDFWVPNGPVTAMTVRDDILYMGGGFTYIGPPTGGGAPVDAVTGSPTAVLHIAGSVSTATPDGSGGWYISGEFFSVGGQPRSRLAHILADGSVTS